MTLPITTKDVCFGRKVVDYDASWRSIKQPDWFSKIYEKLKTLLKKDSNIIEHSNIDRV